MALNKNAITSIGVISSAAVLLGCFFFGISPLNSSTAANEKEAATIQSEANLKNAKYQKFKSGELSGITAQAEIDRFYNSVDKTIGIESASRAVVKALPSGVKISSFNFGSSTSVKKSDVTPPKLDETKPPSGFAGLADSSSSSDTEKKGAGQGLSALPMVVVVTASNYSALSEYLDNLAAQPRLLNVISVDSTRGSSAGQAITATVYLYAFSYIK